MHSVWYHPKTQDIRLYFNKKAISSALETADAAIDPDHVKGWVQDRNGRPEVCVTIRQQGNVDHSLKRELREHLEQHAAFTDTDTWDALVSRALDTGKQDNLPKHDHHETDPDIDAHEEKTQEVEAPRHGKRAGEASRLKIDQIKMKHPVTIEVDHRETKLISDLLKTHPMVTVTTTSLPLADFRVEDGEGNELLIERKRCTIQGKTDFEASIQDNRLFSQSERLKFQAANSDHDSIPVILIEGSVQANAVSMLLQQIDGAISFLSAVQRISVLQSYNANHSAYQIITLAAHFSQGLYKKPSAHRAKPKALWQQKAYTLGALPGVSTQIAEALLEKFGSVRAVVNASEGELSRVKGIGPKRAREIQRVLEKM